MTPSLSPSLPTHVQGLWRLANREAPSGRTNTNVTLETLESCTFSFDVWKKEVMSVLLKDGSTLWVLWEDRCLQMAAMLLCAADVRLVAVARL